MLEAAREFVCAADEVWRLQRGSDADCIFFQRTVNGGERITDRGSRQGTWVLAPGGTVLARVNSRDPEKVLATLARGRRAWSELPESARRLPDDVEIEPEHRWEHSAPERGLVLERIGRQLSPAGLAADPHPRWNRDVAWFSRDEVRTFMPPDASVGDEVELLLLARRLARLHLVDNVAGQTLPFADEEVREARVTARVVARSGNTVDLVLEGHTRAVAEGPWLLGESLWVPSKEIPHGIECTLAGFARLDLPEATFDHFELVAVGRHWGRTQMNGRGRDDSPGRVAFHLGITDLHVAPTFVAHYDVPWVVPPEIPTWVKSPAECGLDK